MDGKWKWIFIRYHIGLSQIFNLIVSTSETTSNKNIMVWKHVEKENSSLSGFSCRSRFVAWKRRLLYLSIYTVTPEKTIWANWGWLNFVLEMSTLTRATQSSDYKITPYHDNFGAKFTRLKNERICLRWAASVWTERRWRLIRVKLTPWKDYKDDVSSISHSPLWGNVLDS